MTNLQIKNELRSITLAISSLMTLSQTIQLVLSGTNKQMIKGELFESGAVDAEEPEF